MRNSTRDDEGHEAVYCRVLNHIPVDSYVDLEDSEEEEEESSLEIGCPYCLEGYDAIGLCVHLEDQHPLEIKLGLCPICTASLGRNMISHLIIQHESVLKGLCKRKFHGDESFSIVSLLRKKLQEHSRSTLKELTSVTSSTSSATDPLLLSFVNNSSQSHESRVDSSADPSSSKIIPMDDMLNRGGGGGISASSFGCKDHEENAQKSDFIQSMLLSTIFPDIL